MLSQRLERQGKDYYQMRVLEWTMIEAVGATHPKDNLSVVFTGFKDKVESRVYSEQERLELRTRNDMWREFGLLTEHRKAFASALARTVLNYADENTTHCGIQLAYVGKYDAIWLMHVKYDQVYAKYCALQVSVVDSSGCSSVHAVDEHLQLLQQCE